MEEKIQVSRALILFLLGCILMLVGLFSPGIKLIALPGIGIGGSIMATAIVNWMLTKHLHGLPIPQIAEAMGDCTQFIRTEQKVELTFTIDTDKDRVKVEKRHSYKLRCLSSYKKNYTISMYTDGSSLTPGDYGGFVKVVGPRGKKLEGNELKKCIKNDPGKHTFTNKYKLATGNKQDQVDKNKFEFVSFDYYRLLDRLIWTVQNLSDGFIVHIKNRTGVKNPFNVKVNHHREREIHEQNEKEEDGLDEIFIDFNSYILPYQGFEIMWNFSENKK